MRWRGAVATLLVTTALAAAQGKTKDEPDKFAKAAKQAFLDARAADEAGKLSDALRLYQKANAISPHPNTVFNIADVQRRLKDYRHAIESYKKYLELEPDATDRKDVEKLIVELQAMPGTLEVEVKDEPDFHAFIDGKAVSGTPPRVDVPDGQHAVDVVTPISYDYLTCSVSGGSRRTCNMHMPPRVDGNVVISGPPWLNKRSWSSGGIKYHTKSRFDLPPGRYEVFVIDKNKQCDPIKFEVAKGDAVTYVYLDLPDKYYRMKECVPVKPTQQVIRFKP